MQRRMLGECGKTRSASSRTLLAMVLAAAAVAAVPAATSAGERWLQNDTFSGSATGNVTVPELSLNEGYAVRFSADPGEYPVWLSKLQFVFVTNPANPGTDCGLYWLKVYADPTGAAAPGALLFDSEAVGEGLPFEIPGSSSAIQELDLSDVPGFPLSLTGDFRVELRAEDDTCVSVFGNDHLPLLYVDQGVTPGRNFLWGYPAPGVAPSWFDIAALGVPGDFVLRAYVTTSGTTPPPDVVQPDTVQPDTVQPDTVQPDGVVTEDVATPPPDSGTPPREDTGGSPGADGVGPAPDVPARADIASHADAAAGAVIVTGVVPASGPNDAATDIRIVGAGFQLGVTVTLDADPLAITDVGPQRISARVPAGLSPGVKTILVENPDGQVATLADAFTVTGASGTGGGGSEAAASGCGVSGPADGAGAAALALLVGGLLAAMGVRRRRRSVDACD